MVNLTICFLASRYFGTEEMAIVSTSHVCVLHNMIFSLWATFYVIHSQMRVYRVLNTTGDPDEAKLDNVLDEKISMKLAIPYILYLLTWMINHCREHYNRETWLRLKKKIPSGEHSQS
jgi:hypothetical protein